MVGYVDGTMALEVGGMSKPCDFMFLASVYAPYERWCQC